MSKRIRKWTIEITTSYLLGSKRCSLPGCRVSIPFLSHETENQLFKASEIVLSEMNAVPVVHVPARRFLNVNRAKSFLQEIYNLGVRDVLVLGGEAGSSESEHLPDAESVIQVMTQDFHSIGIASYPEGSSKIPNDILWKCQTRKLEMLKGRNPFIVTQICMDPHAVDGWLNRFGQENEDLPIFLGIIGPNKTKNILDMSYRLGFGAKCINLDSEIYQPDELVNKLETLRDIHKNLAIGYQVSTFNKVNRSIEWIEDYEKECSQQGLEN